MIKVLIVQPIAEEGMKLLVDEGFEVKLLESDSIENLRKEVVDADAILVRNARIPREVIERGEKLKVIGRHGVGLENIDVESATENGVQVTNTPIANSVSVAEHVIALMLALAKNLRKKVDYALREGRFEVNHEWMGIELEGKTLSVLGLGNVGRSMGIEARILQPGVRHYH